MFEFVYIDRSESISEIKKLRHKLLFAKHANTLYLAHGIMSVPLKSLLQRSLYSNFQG